MNDTAKPAAAPAFGNVDDWHTNDERARTGAPLSLGNGRTITVRRSGARNREFMAAVAEVDANDEAAQFELYARHIVAGWSGINDANGEPIAYTPEACVALFRYCPEIFEAVWMFAAVRGNYRDQELEGERETVKA